MLGTRIKWRKKNYATNLANKTKCMNIRCRRKKCKIYDDT
jgi:hypothetical protein